MNSDEADPREKQPTTLSPLLTSPVRTTLLSNGRLATLITETGTGYTALRNISLTHWRADPIEDHDGYFIYLRDVETGHVWSCTYQPIATETQTYRCTESDGSIEISRSDYEIESRLSICIPPHDNVELRQLTLTNYSTTIRRIELTSYLEVVLAPRAAHESHPAFSKLFNQTEYRAEFHALLATRRARSNDEKTTTLGHWISGDTTLPMQYETDRARFIGRGHNLTHPHALTSDQPLSGTLGNVLDPILSLRCQVTLEAGASKTLTFCLGAGEAPQDVLNLISRYQGRHNVAKAFKETKAYESGLHKPYEIEATYTAFIRQRLFKEFEFIKNTDNSPRYTPAFDHPSDNSKTPLRDPDNEPLLFDNGYGGFSPDSKEYVIRVSPQDDAYPPLPWSNVIANPACGCIVSERGSMSTWTQNSREHRLTPWHNDPVCDPYGEALYIRDEDLGIFWSPLPGPAPNRGEYIVRHGFGYTEFQHHSQNVGQHVRIFVPTDDPVKIIHLTLYNHSDRHRRISLFSYQHLALGTERGEPDQTLTTEFIHKNSVLLAQLPDPGDFPGVAFAAATGGNCIAFTTQRASFIGLHHDPSRPRAVCHDLLLDGQTGTFSAPCFALQLQIELAPGETNDCVFILGEGKHREDALALAVKYASAHTVDESTDTTGKGKSTSRTIDTAFADVQNFWDELRNDIQIKTPDPALDLMINGWLTYQNLSCRIWGRSAFYQSGGAFGFRDQLQDAAALIYLRPELTRAQIKHHAAHQFIEGDVLHWWHPPASRGIRTRFSDDLLWLPYVTAFYVHTTGDHTLLDETEPFITAHTLAPGEDEAYLLPEDAAESADIYTHCCRALDRSLTQGAHGLPLMGTGDWNDGMNRVGREGSGESVWLGFFIVHILREFLPLCETRQDHKRIKRYKAYRNHLNTALNEAGWDGAWYRRAFYDDGTPLGSTQNDECRIDTIAQAWAVISGAAPPKRANQALDALEHYLIAEDDGLIRLLTPPFNHTPHDPGYIKGYVPGVRENGGQYTHGALWAVKALAEAGRSGRAVTLLKMLNPINHALTPAEVTVYKVEPYVVAADVYGVAPHIGRGGWTWYTGSAGWFYRVALESVLGFTVSKGEMILLKPCIPSHWDGFTLSYRIPDTQTVYNISVENSAQGNSIVTEVTVDNTAGEIRKSVACIPLKDNGKCHDVRVILGK